jgi:hypothetical protein
MSMAGARDIFGAGGKLHSQHSFGNEVGGARAKDVHAEDAIALLIGDDLGDALGLVERFGSTVSDERKLADFVGLAGFFDLLCITS